MSFHCMISLLTLAAVCSTLLAAPAFPQGGHAITQKIPIPGQGGWDYLAVDEGARRLYVSHGTQVEVLDIDSKSLVGLLWLKAYGSA